MDSNPYDMNIGFQSINGYMIWILEMKMLSALDHCDKSQHFGILEFQTNIQTAGSGYSKTSFTQFWKSLWQVKKSPSQIQNTLSQKIHDAVFFVVCRFHMVRCISETIAPSAVIATYRLHQRLMQGYKTRPVWGG